MLAFATRIPEIAAMARRAQTKPRKDGCQSRSRATVDALVEATARVLTKEGYERASTNRIASVAGVSIGSLYQYFPSKEALVAAVIERHAQELSRVVRDTYFRIAALPIEAGAREFVRAAIAAHRVDPKLHRILTKRSPAPGSKMSMQPCKTPMGFFAPIWRRIATRSTSPILSLRPSFW